MPDGDLGKTSRSQVWWIWRSYYISHVTFYGIHYIINDGYVDWIVP